MNERYLEDFQAGHTFGSGRIHIDADRIKSFAAEFDPQPFHLDERAALIVHGRPASSGETHA
jgi:acyl dehydratase